MKYFYPLYIIFFITAFITIWIIGEQNHQDRVKQQDAFNKYWDSVKVDIATRSFLNNQFIQRLPDSVKKMSIKKGTNWVTKNPKWLMINKMHIEYYKSPRVWQKLWNLDSGYTPNNYDSVFIRNDSIIMRRQNGNIEHYSLALK